MKFHTISSLIIALLSGYLSFSQCPAANFSLPASACMEEQIAFTNTSTDAVSYEWDFCIGGFLEDHNELTDEAIADLSDGWGFDIANDGANWYGFIVDRSGEKILRLDYGTDINSSPTVTDLGDFGGVFNDPEDIELFEANGEWFGFVGSLTANHGIVRLEFGTSLSNTPTATNIGTFGFSGRVRGLEVVNQNGNLVLVLVNYNNNLIVRVDYGNSFYNTVDPGDIYSSGSIAGASLLVDIEFVPGCGDLVAFATSINNDNIIRLNFGSDILSTPTVENSYTFPGVDRPFYLKMMQEGDSYFGVVVNESSEIRVINFGDLDNATSPVELTKTTYPRFQGLYAYRNEGVNYVQGITNLDTRMLISYEADCGESSDFSISQDALVSYSTSGTKDVWLKAIKNDSTDNSIQSINVTTDSAPVIDFNSDNICVSSPVNFVPTATSLTSYSWDFDQDGMEDSSLEFPSYEYAVSAGGPGPGTYTVRLDVVDGTCNNFIEKQITIYPDLPIPSFTAVPNECINTEIQFTNTTDESQHIGVIEYDWDFNGENGTPITDPSPTYTFTTPGTKQVTVTAQIPGCETTSSIFEIEISSGPTSAFTASSFSICETETVSFTDQSTGSPVSFSWDFGDGFSSNSQNPDHLFATAGNYDVELTVTDALGCQNTITQEVAVATLPSVDFNFDIPCTSEAGIQFTDESTVSGSDIASWNWFVDDVLTSTAEDPVLNFDMEGTVNIRLEAISLNGCSSTYSEDIEILATPEPDFSIDLGCDGEPSTFQDLTSSPGNPIGTWLWTLDGTNYSTQDISHTFSGPGIFEVTLEVTGQNFCSETVTHNVEILELPMVQFSVSGDCSNEIITAVDESTIDQDPIVSREWRLDGTSIGNGDQILLESLPGATYELELEVVTQSGCITNATQNLLVNSSPSSVFEPSKTFGLPGDQISFTNQSSGASGYQWLLDDAALSTDVDQEILFSEPGTYQVSLVASNDLGCNDTTTSEILIAIPEVDLSIGQFEVIDNNNTGSIFIEIQNNSNLPVEVTEVVVELENQFSVTEQVLSLIGIGESELVNLNVGIPLTVTQLSYLCVTLNSQYVDYPDITPVDNEKCIAIQPDVVVEAPFPNPAIDQTRVKMVAPQAGVANLSIFNSSGKIEFSSAQNVTEGLNNFFIELNNLESGVYFVRLDFMGTSNVQRIVKL